MKKCLINIIESNDFILLCLYEYGLKMKNNLYFQLYTEFWLSFLQFYPQCGEMVEDPFLLEYDAMSLGNRFSTSPSEGWKPIVQRRHVISRKTEVLKLLAPQERAWNMEQVLCGWLLVNWLATSEKLLKIPISIPEFANY